MNQNGPRQYSTRKAIKYAAMISVVLSTAFLYKNVALSPYLLTPRANLAQAETADCPTGVACGSGAAYCESYTPPSTRGATLIRSLPYRIKSSGRYYLNEDLTSPTVGIAVLADNVDINLNGHTLTYGSSSLRTGASSIGNYGVLLCNTGNLASEGLDPSYGANGFCRNGGISARNVTIENGAIVQSPDASQFYDPTNCPGSGVAESCSHHHESTASDVISAQYASGLTVTHVILTWQNVDSNGVHIAWQVAGPGHKVECNSFHDKVTEINNRSYPRGVPIFGQNAGLADHGVSIRYNTLLGSPQSGIVAAVPGSVISYNDIELGHYQFPPFTKQGKMYSNDYAIGACVKSGTIAYNYIHSISGRGIGCIFGGDMGAMKVHHNYVKTTEQAVNGEYGPNGANPGAPWVGGCEINGGRGFESKESPNIQIYDNTFVLTAAQCGAAGIAFVGFPCRDVRCPDSLPSFVVRNNTIQLQNTSGTKQQPYAQPLACFLLDSSQGNYDNYFSPIWGNKCTTDGDFVTTVGYGPGNYFTFQNNVFSKGEHPLSTGCGGAAESPCGFLMHWHGQRGPEPNELGFVFSDMILANGATANFFGDGGTPLARGARVAWTYGITVERSDNAAPIRSATVSVVDSLGANVQCATNEDGKCSLFLVQSYVNSREGDATLVRKEGNPQEVTISAEGCLTSRYSLESNRTLGEHKVLNCRVPPDR